MLRNEDDEEDDLYYRPKCCLNENARYLGHLSRILLASETEQVCNWDHCDVAQRKDGDWLTGKGEVQDEGDGHNWPQQVGPLRCIATRPPGDFDEMRSLKPRAAALSVRVDVLGHDVV